MSRKEKQPIHEKMINTLDLPKDLLNGAAIVTVTGRQEVLVENYKGILNLEDSVITIQTKTCRLQILGRNLSVEYYTNEEMKITGFIDSVGYESS